MAWNPHVTVAAVIEHAGKFLLVEERVKGALVLNQPAGHLDPDESLPTAVARETLEETGGTFVPHGIVGVYLWHRPDSGHTILRVAFHGELLDLDPARELDEGIERTVWLSRAELAEPARALRSPFVTRCIDDYCAGRSYPLEMLAHLTASAATDD